MSNCPGLITHGFARYIMLTQQSRQNFASFCWTNFFQVYQLCLLVTVILKVLNWGVYRSHEIFVMMKPGFLSNLNSCIPFKAWLHGWWIYNRSFTGKNILLDHKVEGCIRDLNKTYCRYPLRYINSLDYTWKTLV